MGKITGTILLLLLMSNQAVAQVAVPEIIPGAPRLLSVRFAVFPQASFTPENPAALRWGAPSRIGGGTIDGDSNDTAGVLASEFTGTFGGFRLVGDQVAIAVEQVSYSLEQSGIPLKKEASSFALAFSSPDWLAYGFSAENQKATRNPVTGEEIDEVGNGTLGLSFNINQTFFIGLAVGEESRSSNALGITTTSSRPITMAGLGLRGGGGLIWHMELSSTTKSPFETGTGITEEGFTLNQAVLELAFWNLIFTGAVHSITGTGTADNTTVEGVTADFGLAPLQGIVITGRLERNRLFIDNTSAILDEAKSFTLGWQF